MRKRSSAADAGMLWIETTTVPAVIFSLLSEPLSEWRGTALIAKLLMSLGMLTPMCQV